MALPRPSSHPRHRWRDAPQARSERLAVHAAVAAGVPVRSVARVSSSRRRRLLTRAVPVLCGIVAVVLLCAWALSPGGMSAARVAEAAHDQVLRDVIRRTGDYSAQVGRLSCVELEPGRGNCLADLRTTTHAADGLMVSVGYLVSPDDGQLELVVKLP